MTRKASIALLSLSTVWLASCAGSSGGGADLLTKETLLRHTEILSSDEFEGRAPATRGEDLTVDYLVSELQRIGVEPGMPDGSYIQQVPLLGMDVDRSTARMVLRGPSGARSLEYGREFVAWPSDESEQVRIRGAELVYVGYGIQAPEFDWDDYKGVDVKGKVLVFKNSDPGDDPDLFAGNARLYYGRWSYKYEKALEMGALGAIIVHTTPTAGYPWLVVSNSWGRRRFTLKSAPGSLDGAPAFNAWLTTASSAELFEAAGLSLSEQLAAADSPGFTPVPLSGVTLDASLDASYGELPTRNVVGRIPGSDPALAEEHLVLTAHHDHLGITLPVRGDSINNGAHDDAVGVASLLNMAEALQSERANLRRSTLFLLVGAEEMGLLGSKYWAENPTVDPAYVTANLNLDMVQVYGPTRDLVIVGYGRNSFSDLVEQVAAEQGRTVVPDPAPEQGLFYRSDHFSMAKVGIPAVFPGEGRDFIGKPEGYSELVDSVRASNYHSVADEINEYWDLQGAENDLKLLYEATIRALNADDMMSWKPGDEFEAARNASLERRNAERSFP